MIVIITFLSSIQIYRSGANGGGDGDLGYVDKVIFQKAILVTFEIKSG